MSDSVETLLWKFAGPYPDRVRALVDGVVKQNLQTSTQFLEATGFPAGHKRVQSVFENIAAGYGQTLPSDITSWLRAVVDERRLEMRGFPESPPNTTHRILFTAPHSLPLRREGHKAHLPETYTGDLARYFAQSIGGVFLTWKKEENERALDYYKTKGEPDSTHMDPNYTPCTKLHDSSWTRNLHEMHGLFGLSRPCLHVDLHGCKDPGPAGGSHLVVGLRAMEKEKRPSVEDLRLKWSIIFSYALRGMSINVRPRRQLTGAVEDDSYLTLTQQSLRKEGGAWASAVQLEMSKTLRTRLARSRGLRDIMAEAILLAWLLTIEVPDPAAVRNQLAQFRKRVQTFYITEPIYIDSKSIGAESNGKIESVDSDGEDVIGVATANSEKTPPPFNGNWEMLGAQLEEMAADIKKGTSNTSTVAALPPGPIPSFMLLNWLRHEGPDESMPTAQKAILSEPLPSYVKMPSATSKSVDKNNDISQLSQQNGASTKPAAPRRSAASFALSKQAANSDEAAERGVPEEQPILRKKTFFIAGSWDKWSGVHEMKWTGSDFVYTLEIGQQAWESFQILLDGKWETTIYPSVADANPYTKYRLRGPNDKGHGKNFTIGKPHNSDVPEENTATPGEHYEVAVNMDSRLNIVKKIDWRVLRNEEIKEREHAQKVNEAIQPKSAKNQEEEKQHSMLQYCGEGQQKMKSSYSIIGSWDGWSTAHVMECTGSKFVYTLCIGPSGSESFRILQAGEWEKSIYPNVTHGNPFTKYSLNGPDDRGQGKSFTIGCPPYSDVPHRNKAQAHDYYEVALSLDSRGKVCKVEWCLLSAKKKSEEEEKRQKLRNEAEEDREFDVLVHIDRGAGIHMDLRIKEGATIKTIKDILAILDPTGMTKPQEIGLRVARYGRDDKLLDDAELVTTSCVEFDLVPFTV